MENSDITVIDMEGKIVGEDSEGIGVTVTDAAGADRKIEMGLNGDVTAHRCKEYPTDPNARSNYEDEYISQARRFARFYVSQERGYETLPWDEDPERLAAALTAVHGLSDDEFEAHFGDFYRQLAHHYRDDVEQVFRPPIRFDPESEFLLYQQDIYLEESIHDFREEAVESVGSVLEELEFGSAGGGLANRGRETTVQLIADRADGAGIDPTETASIDAVTGIHSMYYAGMDDERTVPGDDPHPDRDPDARVELYPLPFESLEQCRAYVYLNLACQIRDCYIGVGLEPPEPYKITGPGKWNFTKKYMHFQMYDQYDELDADIPGYLFA